MPWCDECGKFYNPNTLRADGTCPQDHPVAPPRPGRDHDAGGGATANQKVPWHFWLLVAGVAVYLGWRVVQLVLWLL